jgi:hypothetical protein
MTGTSFSISKIDRVAAWIDILTSNIVWLFFAFQADNLPGVLQSGSFWHTVWLSILNGYLDYVGNGTKYQGV